jgi:flagellin
MYVNNIIIDRNRLPASMQHLVSQISVQSEAEAKNATDVLSYSIEQTGFTRAILGATINRYQSSIEGALVRGADMRKARSRVMDAEYTIETSKLAKQQILAQASMAMLAQANASKDAVLELIR